MSLRTLSKLSALPALLALACGGTPEARLAEPAPVRAPLGVAERTAAAGSTELSGFVQADRTAAVSTRVMAMVTAVHVRLGDRVDAGQALVSIDPTAAQGQASQAAGAVTQAEAALALAERNYERYQALAATNAASELELDMARSQYEQARGAVEQARGAAESARSVAGDSRVTAPFAGRIAQRYVEVGDLAAPGRPLVLLESERGRQLTLAVPETLMARTNLAIGTPIAVTLDALPDLGRLEGTVVEVSPGPDPASHSFTVKLTLPAGDLPAGSAARAFLPAVEREAVLVPRSAIVESGGLTLVVVRDEDGRARSRVVTLGAAAGDDRVEVLSGLAGGEQLLLGLEVAPAAGALVEPAPEDRS